MIRPSHAATLVLVTLLFTACGEDKAVGPKPAEITGDWTATKVEYVNRAAPATRVSFTSKGRPRETWR